VLFGAEANNQLKSGFDKMARLLAVTLGPTGGLVLSQPATGSQPAVLTDAATIARQLLALPNRAEDVGAMLLRNVVWRMHEKAGDGCATTAVLAQAILHQAHRYVAAGGNATSLRRGIDRAALAASAALQQMARPIQASDDLILVAQGVTGDLELSKVLGRVFARLGPEAYVTIEDYVAPYLHAHYYEGGRWSGRLASAYFITDTTKRRAMQPDCHVALFAGEVGDLDDLRPLLDIVMGSERHRLFLAAHEIKGAALTTLVANHQAGTLPAISVELRRVGTQRQADFDDLAALTGATVLSTETGRSLRHVRAVDLGTACQAEADADEVIIIGDGSHAHTVAEQAALLRGRMAPLEPDQEAWNEVRFRLARLSGQVAKLMIGAHTETERNVIRHKAEKALRALPIALREGVVAGGGVAYLDAIPAVRRVEASGDEAWGVEIVARALEEPFRRIVSNSGVASPSAMLAKAQWAGPGHGFDVESEQTTDMYEAGILDAVGVLRHALEIAVSGAVMALTTETIVLKKSPETSVEP
jgi:chaperonin GroEL